MFTCFDVRCITHVPSLIETDSLKYVHESVTRIRSKMRFVRSSSARLEKFKEFFFCVAGIESRKWLCLDVSIRWNSTFFMLETVEQYGLTFDAMDEEDTQYTKHFEANERLGWPIDDDWDNMRIFVEFF